MEVVSVDNWSSNYVQSSSQNVTANKPTPSFYRLDALRAVQPTVSVHLREDSTVRLGQRITTPTFIGVHLGARGCTA